MSLQFRVQGPNISSEDGTDIFRIPPGYSEIGRVPTPQDSSDTRPECALPAAFVSRHHARIEYTNTECWITDLGSTHGTAIDGRPLEPHIRTKVTLGDVITIARQFRLTLDEISDEVVVVDPGPALESHKLPTRKPTPRPYGGEIPPGLSLTSLHLLKCLPEVYLSDQMALPTGTLSRNGTNWASRQLLSPLNSFRHGSGGDGGENDIYQHDGPGFYRSNNAIDTAGMGSSFLSRYLALIESVWLPLQWTTINFDLFFDARTAPNEFIRWLLSWFDSIYDPSWSERQLRTMLSISHRLHARRGTRWALRWALWLYTGKEPDINDSDESLPPDTFHVRLKIDPNTVSEQSVRAIIDAYKPAHTFYEILDL